MMTTNRQSVRSESPEYMRDGRAPIPESEVTSRVMSANKGRDTKPELILRKALRDIGLSGYRIHWNKIPGKPDIAFPGRKIAIFIHGCFWHRCPKCNLALPKSHSDYWASKFKRNIERDKKYEKDLKKNGWQTIVLWECEVIKDALALAARIKGFIVK